MGLAVWSRLVGSALGVVACAGCSSPDSGDDPMGSSGSAGASMGGSGGSSPLTGGSAGSAVIGGSGGAAAGSGGAAAGNGGGGAGALGGSGGGSSRGLSIKFDYRFDTVGYFALPERRAALEAAGAAWSARLQNDFDPIPAGSRLRLRNPENRDEYVWVEGIEEEIDDLLVFVGTSEAIPGLGRGGPAGTAETGDLALDADLVERQLGAEFEPWAGSISFKASSSFFFDPTPETTDDIPPEQYDFITNATHELGHVLGFGASMAFTNFVDGATFTGPAAVAEFGAPAPLEPDAVHFLSHTQSGGVDTIMDSGQSNGVRSVPTPLDLAVFQDLGFEIGN